MLAPPHVLEIFSSVIFRYFIWLINLLINTSLCFWLVFTWWLGTVPFLYTCWPFVWFIWRHEGLDGFFIFNWIFSYWAPEVSTNINHLSDINIKFAHSSLFLRLHLSLTSFSLQCRKFSAWNNHTCLYLLLSFSWDPI